MRVTEDISVREVAVLIPRDRCAVEAALAAAGSRVEVPPPRGLAPAPRPDESADGMVLEVAAEVLRAANVPARDVGLLVHSAVLQGEEDYKSPPAVAHALGADRAIAVGIRQLCNGAGFGLHTAVSHMLTEERLSYALVLTADAGGDGAGSAWRRRFTVTLVDAATAVLVARGAGPLMIRSVATGGRPAQAAVLPPGQMMADADRASEALRDVPLMERLSLERCVRDTIRTAYADAALTRADPRLVKVFMPRLEESGLKPLIPNTTQFGDAEIVQLGALSGHLFAGDLAANLSCLLGEHALPPGAFALIVNMGVGFAVTSVVVQAGDVTGCAPS